MTVAHELVALLERAAHRIPLPRVRTLHLPPVAGAADKDGEFCALELDDGAFGLTYALLEDALALLTATPERRGLGGLDALAVARWFAEESGVQRTIGFAAVNALTRTLFERAGYRPGASTDSIGLLDPQPGDHVGMIGFFPPLASRIVRAGARLTVVELRADLAGSREGYRITLEADELRSCNKVLSTSTVLLNDTLDRMLELGRGASYFAMIGPGAGCLPDPLFARGVTLLGGTWIVDRERFCAALAAGHSWGGCARKFAILPGEYPGIDALLERAEAGPRVGRLYGST
jgi:uncharacterized protein (DUF4213/DUF364 family)